MNTGQIFKTKTEVPFCQVPRSMLRDKTMSAKAKGLLCMLLSLPSDWVLYKSTLGQYFSDGRSSLDTAWDELEKKGYIVSAQIIGRDGKFGYNHIVYHLPFNGDKEPLHENRSGFPAVENPSTENPPLHIENTYRDLQIENTLSGETIISPTENDLKPQTPSERKPTRVAPAPPLDYPENFKELPEGERFAIWFQIQYGKPSIPYNPKKWATEYDRLTRIDKKTKDEVRTAVTWARADSFWVNQFESPMKLREKNKDGKLYIDVFLEKSLEQATKKEGTKAKHSSKPYNPTGAHL
jgi:hypothetical protein